MIAYRDAVRAERAQDQLRRLAALLRAPDPLDFLVEAGELEQGAVDALDPRSDGWAPAHEALRALSLAAARRWLAGGAAAERDARQALARLRALQLPREYGVRTPEGFAHYALDPAAYAATAQAFRGDVGAARARAAVVLGVRSIGTTLSAVVAAVAGSERTLTIRVRGETGARAVHAAAPLLARLRGWLAGDPDVLVVDEGPGATGETFLRAWEWLRGLGVPDRRIRLFPSHTGGIIMAPLERREWFDRTLKHVPPLEDRRAARAAARLGLGPPRDLSAGRWRQLVEGARDEPARAFFERAKHLAQDVHGRPVLLRFAGAGRYGAETEARARTLASAGLGPEVLGAAEGFLAQRWWPSSIRGRRPRAGSLDPGDAALVRAACEYVVARAPLFRTGREVEREPLLRLLEENAREALQPPARLLARALERVRALPAREAVLADARMQPREWVRGEDGYGKVDGVDHGDGLRWPGPIDAAWDVAAVAVELALSLAGLAGLVERSAAAGRESASELAAAVQAYRAVYAACALGDATLSAREALTPEDRSRLETEAGWYRSALDRELRAA